MSKAEMPLNPDDSASKRVREGQRSKDPQVRRPAIHLSTNPRRGALEGGLMACRFCADTLSRQQSLLAEIQKYSIRKWIAQHPPFLVKAIVINALK